MSEELKKEIVELLAKEIVKKMDFQFTNYGLETIGLKIKIEYDGQQLTYEDL